MSYELKQGNGLHRGDEISKNVLQLLYKVCWYQTKYPKFV
jgi:hypothetical protein